LVRKTLTLNKSSYRIDEGVSGQKKGCITRNTDKDQLLINLATEQGKNDMTIE
jgi:hypothetical protein